VFRDMEQWNWIRQRVLRDGVSIRQVQRETGLHHQTIKKVLSRSAPPPFACPAREKPKLGAYVERIAAILQAERDENIPKKQRHTAKRIFERLREEGYGGGYTQVKEAVRELRRTSQEVFMPLRHDPGEAQVDFGHALVKFQGELTKVAFFVLALPHSDGLFVTAYPRECTETFQDGHVRAFAFIRGVPRRISYDNARTSVSQIIGAHARKLTDGFLQLQSHYLFQEHFCRVHRPNEKGVVESMVKFIRLNFFVPVPEVDSWKELNYLLARHCLETSIGGCAARAVQSRICSKRTRRPFCRCPRAPSTPAAKRLPPPTGSRWYVSMPTTTPCPCATPTIPWWPKAIRTRS